MSDIGTQTLEAHNDTTKPIPTGWEPPSSFFPWCIFHTMCFCLTFHKNLEYMWEIFREPGGWAKFHSIYLAQINQLGTVQGLVLTTVAVFTATPPPMMQQEINYDADGLYRVLSESLVFSLLGLLFQIYTSVVGQTFQKQEKFDDFQQSWFLFLVHIFVLSIPMYTFAISLLLLIYAITATGFLIGSSQTFNKATFFVAVGCLALSFIHFHNLYSSVLPVIFRLRKKARGKTAEGNGDNEIVVMPR